jgi:hypothetical protein
MKRRATTSQDNAAPPNDFSAELQAKVPGHLLPLFDRRDGGAQLLSKLPSAVRPEDVAVPSDLQRAWELCGLYYFNQGRVHEAVAIFHALYEHMLKYQCETGVYAHKGMPLVWIE